MDKFSSMQYFCRVVELESLSATAQDFGCSVAVVSKYIRQLEDWTDCRLIARTTRAMKVTEQGQQFYAYCKKVLTLSEETLCDLQGKQKEMSGKLVIATPISLTVSFLSDYLIRFHKLYPDIEMEIRMNDQPVDLVKQGIDLALRGQEKLADSTLVATPVMTIHRTLCASPEYWHEHPKPQTPDDLVNHNCVRYLLASDLGCWQFLADGVTHSVNVDGNVATDCSLQIIAELLAGKGIGLVPRVLVAQHLASGALEAALTNFAAPERTLFAVYPGRLYLSKKVQELIKFLKRELAT